MGDGLGEIFAIAVLELLFVAADACGGDVHLSGTLADEIFGSEGEGAYDAGLAVTFGRDDGSHGGDALTATETHNERNDNIIEMMTESELAAVEFLSKTVKLSAPETRTENAGGVGEILFFDDLTYFHTDNVMLPAFFPAEIGSCLSVEFGETGIKSDGNDVKIDGRGGSELMEKLNEDETVLAAGETAKYAVFVGDHAVSDNGFPGDLA